MAIIHGTPRGREAVTAYSVRGSLIPGLLDFCSFGFFVSILLPWASLCAPHPTIPMLSSH